MQTLTGWHLHAERTLYSRRQLCDDIYTFTYMVKTLYLYTFTYGENTVLMETVMGWENYIYGDNYGMRTLYLWRHYGLMFTHLHIERTLYLWRQFWAGIYTERTLCLWRQLWAENSVFMEAIMGWEHCICGHNYGLRTLYFGDIMGWEHCIYGDNKLWAENAIHGDYHGLRTLFMETIMGWEHYLWRLLWAENIILMETIMGWEHCIHGDNSGLTSTEHHILRDSYRRLKWRRSPDQGGWCQSSVASCWSQTPGTCHHWWSQYCELPQFHPVQQGTKNLTLSRLTYKQRPWKTKNRNRLTDGKRQKQRETDRQTGR